MRSPPISLLALCLASAASPVLAATAGSFADGGNTLVSAMMLFLANEDIVYILDKAESNPQQISGHSAWGAAWDFHSHQATLMDVRTNTFCSSGFHLPNGSYVTLGGNGAIGPGGAVGSQPNNEGSATWDSVLQDFDGGRSIRILNPCKSGDNFVSSTCAWFDDATVLSMQTRRWYSAAEALGDGTIAIIGGFANGGYINRNVPNTDPAEGGAAILTVEFYPSKGVPQAMPFLNVTSGLNAYAHTFLMASGNVFVQANYSTMLWNPDTFAENYLPNMPKNVVRVYPASGAVAMLPMTPANNYSQTIIFCGGSDMAEPLWGNYSWPFTNPWDHPASNDCQRITPEPADGSAPVYQQDDDMLEGRTMGQFIILPNGKLLVLNGGTNGTAGFSQATLLISDFGQMPFGESLASGPVGTPAIYDPNAPAGSRWSNQGLSKSPIPRLYHSSAMLLPDASVLVAGSNPNLDVNMSTIFPTTYQAEIFYPPYFSATTRPVPSGVPQTLSYGGNPFDITIPPTSYSGSANDAADNTTVVLLRGGFTTHAMNMGQRFMQLNNTYTVQSDGSIILHVAQPPPNPNLLQPGPAFLYVNIHGIPSNGTFLIVGNGQIGAQPTAPASVLPPNVRLDSASGKGSTSGSGSTSGDGGSGGPATTASTSHTGAVIGGVVGGIAVLAILGAVIGICLSRRRRAANRQIPSSTSYPMANSVGGLGGAALGARGMRSSDSSAFVPLQHDNQSQAWNASSASVNIPYRDEGEHGGRGSGLGMSMDYDPYATTPVQHHDPQQYGRSNQYGAR